MWEQDKAADKNTILIVAQETCQTYRRDPAAVKQSNVQAVCEEDIWWQCLQEEQLTPAKSREDLLF